jgi:peroxiredoxin
MGGDPLDQFVSAQFEGSSRESSSGPLVDRPRLPLLPATAPALNEFHDEYSERGLQVIGFYHHKGDAPLNPGDVQKFSDHFRFKFPVAIDPSWKTLHAWWLDRDQHGFTSVSFLIDRKGVVRHIHPGGEYVKGDKDYKLMREKIEELLKEK